MNKNLKVDEIHNELEKQPGFLRFSSDKNLLTEPIPSFLKFCQKIGTPLSQNINGDLVLSVKILPFQKMTQRFGDQIQIKS